MVATASESLAALYLSDETAWLETMADLIARKELGELDYDNLREYLTDMAIRDRREVLSRLVVLIFHHLKWQFQPAARKPGWQITISEQQSELEMIFESKVLSLHAEDVLSKAYRRAVREAAIETGLPETAFPKQSKFTASEWVALPVPQ